MKKLKPLDNKQKTRLINIAWQQIEKFIKDWQKSPFEWNKERDIQVEITGRIKSAINRDECVYWANYKGPRKIKGFEKGQLSGRICCEPLTYYRYRDGKKYICRPDIVIFDSPKNPDLPEEVWKNKKNEPMLWICEIKYRREWRADDSDRKGHWDLKKMKYLIKQKDGPKCACWLHIYLKRATSGNGVRAITDGKLRIYDVRLPFQK